MSDRQKNNYRIAERCGTCESMVTDINAHPQPMWCGRDNQTVNKLCVCDLYARRK